MRIPKQIRLNSNDLRPMPVLALWVLLTCLPACESIEAVSHTDLCERAARHIETCTGTYLSPPICEGQALVTAQTVLNADCDILSRPRPVAKGDHALCNWFGMDCLEDEIIFWGPRCHTDLDCADGSYCVEERCFDGVDSDEFSTVLDDLTGTVERDGNITRHLASPKWAWKVRKNLIEEATESVYLSTLFMEANDNGYQMVQLLKDAAMRGVDVRLIIDALSQYGSSGGPMLTELAEAGVKVIAFNPLIAWAQLRWSIDLGVNSRIHEKIVLVDSRHAIVGGRNVGDNYLLEGRWRDTDVYVAGPAVADIESTFIDCWFEFGQWELMAGCPMEANYGLYCPQSDTMDAFDPNDPELSLDGASAKVRLVYSDPRTQWPSHGWSATLAMIRAAKESIKITAAYLIPPMRLRRHLIAAAKRGVHVQIITNSEQSGDVYPMYWAALNFYTELIDAGVTIHEWHGTGTLHAKTMVVDEKLGVVGSFNLDSISATINSEAFVVMRNDPTVDDMVHTFEADLQQTQLADKPQGTAFLAFIRTFRITEPLL